MQLDPSSKFTNWVPVFNPGVQDRDFAATKDPFDVVEVKDTLEEVLSEKNKLVSKIADFKLWLYVFNQEIQQKDGKIKEIVPRKNPVKNFKLIDIQTIIGKKSIEDEKFKLALRNYIENIKGAIKEDLINGYFAKNILTFCTILREKIKNSKDFDLLKLNEKMGKLVVQILLIKQTIVERRNVDFKTKSLTRLISLKNSSNCQDQLP